MPFALSQHWSFPSNNFGQITGIADSGIETFKGTPIKSLSREICQNSLDARHSPEQPVRIEFKLFEIEPSQIPEVKSLEDAFKRAQDFWAIQTHNKAKSFFRTALSTIQSRKITCLRISDFNTTGLTGAHKEYNSPWCNLTKSQGASDKSGSNGGSFGIGKFAPYACSSLRTVFYSTSDIEDICAFQGISRLTSFKDKKGDITQGIGFYGNKENAPAYRQFSLDPTYSRDASNHGTDIFILGFTGDSDWKKEMVASVLDGFLYAVYNQSLVVDIDGVLIDRESLPFLMETYEGDFLEHADEYYQTLTEKKVTRVFEKELTSDPETTGKLTLTMMIMPGFHRRVAMIRQTGMKIKDKGNISGLIPFAGVLYIEGEALNSYLRGLENPQHLEWEIDRADSKTKARRLLSELTKFIKSSLDEMRNDDQEEALDPSVGEYLSAMPDSNTENIDKAENLKDAIQDVKVRVTVPVAKPSDASTSTSGESLADDENGDIVVADVPGESGSGGNGEGHGGGPGGGHNPGDGSGDSPIEHSKALSSIAPSNLRSVVRNKANGEYTIVFTPTASASCGILDVFMSAESQNYKADILSVSCSECPEACVKGNRISNLIFKEKQALRINIQLDYHDYCSLEVKAYGSKA